MEPATEGCGSATRVSQEGAGVSDDDGAEHRIRSLRSRSIWCVRGGLLRVSGIWRQGGCGGGGMGGAGVTEAGTQKGLEKVGDRKGTQKRQGL